MSKFFTADTHISHTNILKYCTRPFRDITHMNEIIISNFNKVMGPGDVLYHLGDVAWGVEAALLFFDSLSVNQIHVVFGNHDQEEIKRHPKVKSSGWLKKTKVTGLGGITMGHFPMLAWMGEHHLYGHWHNKGPVYHPKTLDVGVDGHEFYPWSEEELVRRFSVETNNNI